LKKIIPFLLSLLSGVLLWLSWPTSGWSVLLFIAWVPLLTAEEILRKQVVKKTTAYIFASAFICFLIWNTLTTWWVCNSSTVGGIVAIGINTILMSLVFLVYHGVNKKVNSTIAYPALIAFWLAFEYLHLNWEISWPWLTLGNAFAEKHSWVQWYQYTGVLGGSAWILIVNLLAFFLLRSIRNNLLWKLKQLNISMLLLAIFLACALPMFLSYHLYKLHAIDKGDPLEVIVAQPNIDPYNEKFSGNSIDQLAKLLQLVSTVIDSNTSLIIGPETALANGMWEEEIPLNENIIVLKKYLLSYPNCNVLLGLSSFKAYEAADANKPITARKLKNANIYFDAFNTALLLQPNGSLQLYHKSKLVPGVEQMPYPKIFGFLEALALDLGGTSGSLGRQLERTVFKLYNGTLVAPAICYESIYGEFLSGFINNKAGFISIITNDGWWGNTEGHRQHLCYAKLRAIEFRKSIARSANTGISAIINQRGDIEQQTYYWQADVIKGKVFVNDNITFYAKHGDFLGWIACYLTAIIMVSLIVKGFLKRKHNQSKI
jgi:apolipoprotein N-acyltransferase